jgi:hypothetical protein
MSDSTASFSASTFAPAGQANALHAVAASPIVTINASSWKMDEADPAWIAALEQGKVLYFPKLSFELKEDEYAFLTPEMNAEGSRSITLEASGRFKGSSGDEAMQAKVAAMVGRFRANAQQLIETLLPHYRQSIQMATTSYRPKQVESRAQTWRADDKRLHVDAFAGRPNHGERILRVFANINQSGVPRIWRVGEPFEEMVQKFLPRVEKYSPLQARWQQLMRKTKKLRTEYDHLMLQFHDHMKLDADYQQNAPQITMPFAAGSVWVCFSDHALHAAMSGQYMMEQTLNLPVAAQYDPEQSPLAILRRLTGRKLV